MIVLLVAAFIAAISGREDAACRETAEAEFAASFLLMESSGKVTTLLRENPAGRNDELLGLILGNKHLEERRDPQGAFPEKPPEIAGEISLREKLERTSLVLSDFLASSERKGGGVMELMVRDGEKNGWSVSTDEIDALYEKEMEKCKELSGNGTANDKNVPSKLNIREDPDLEDPVDKYDLIFQEIPNGNNYKVHDIGISSELMEYSIFSNLVGFFHPTDFPSRLFQGSLNKTLPLHIIVLQVIKLEGLVLCWVIFWGMLSICLPVAVLMQTCCAKRTPRRLRSEPEKNGTGRCIVLLLYVLMTSLLACVLLMLGSNDRFSRTVEKLPHTADVVLSDVETFIKNTHLQMNFATATAFEQVVQRINQDLKDVDKLLGVQFVMDLERETRLRAAIRVLKDFKSGSAGISGRVRELLRECGMARKSVMALQEALDEVSRRLNAVKKYCQQRDRSLCESLQPTGLTVALNIDEIASNPTLRYFEKIHRTNDFNSTIEEVVRSYEGIPKLVREETDLERTATYDILQKHRRYVRESLGSLEDLSRTLTSNLKDSSKGIRDVTEDMASKDLWRYLAVVGTAFLVSTIWALFACGSPCGCHVITKTGPFLIFGLLLMSLTVPILWILGSVSFIFGGHGKTVVCDRLYEDHFKTLSKIFDQDGILYEEGFFKRVLHSNESLRVEDILRNCEKNHSSYLTFRLENRLDINKVLNFKSWSDFRAILDDISFDPMKIRIQSSALDENLREFSTANKLRELRSKISLPVTHRELVTFKQQVFSVAEQIANLKSANSYQNIILGLEAIIQNQYAAVKTFRDAVLFKLTAIEILYEPLREKATHILTQLRDGQQILKEKGKEISEKNVRRYVFRFERYLNDLQRHSNEQLRRKTAKCGPIWDIFDFTRHQACHLLVDPLNALSFSCFTITIIFIMITPLIVHLINTYKSSNDTESIPNRKYSASVNLGNDVWVTPQSSTSSNEAGTDQGNNTYHSENNWSTPRVHIPPPPRSPTIPMAPSPNPPLPPSTSSSSPTSIKTPPKLGNLFGKSRPTTNPGKTLHDSLKYIQRISKSPRPGRSPRGWL